MRIRGVLAIALGLFAAACADSYQHQRATLEAQHTDTTCALIIGETRQSCRSPDRAHVRHEQDRQHAAALPPSGHDGSVSVPASRFAAQPKISMSDSVPVINVEQVCQGIADQGANFNDYEAEYAKKDCLRTEEEVREKLAIVWGRFDPADKIYCVNETKMGGELSYTELLTCLEMATDVKKMHDEANIEKRPVEGGRVDIHVKATTANFRSRWPGEANPKPDASSSPSVMNPMVRSEPESRPPTTARIRHDKDSEPAVATREPAAIAAPEPARSAVGHVPAAVTEPADAEPAAKEAT